MVIRDELEIGRMKRLFAVVFVIAIATAGWVLWPRHLPAPQARQYLDVSACLLTDPSGIVPGTPGAPVWTAMQTASQATRVMVSYLPDTGPSDAAPMLNTLVERHCALIIATTAAADQVIDAAKANPHQRFLLVTAAAAVAAAPRNTAVISPSAAPAHIEQAIDALAAQA